MGQDRRQNHGKLFCIVLDWLAYFMLLQVAEIQVQLKVRNCTPVLCSRNLLLDVLQLNKL